MVKPTELVKLALLMELTSGTPEVTVGLIDGAVSTNHPDLADSNFREIGGKGSGSCKYDGSLSCQHGTFVAGVLAARRSSVAPAICPGCTLLIRPIFADTSNPGGTSPSATADELAKAIQDCVEAGARVLNISAAIVQGGTKAERALEQALCLAARRGVLVVSAAGNQGTLGSTAMTRHPWVIPVAACDGRGRPMHYSNLGRSIGRCGLSARGDAITSLGTGGKALTTSGTSAAAPFVTGAIALLWSLFPRATAAGIKLAVLRSTGARRNAVVPPLLNAWGSYQLLLGRAA